MWKERSVGAWMVAGYVSLHPALSSSTPTPFLTPPIRPEGSPARPVGGRGNPRDEGGKGVTEP